MSKLYPHQKPWGNYDFHELIKIAKMLHDCAYGSIELNMNDTFGYACAWGVECHEFDLLAVSELYEKFGQDGVVAWASIQEGVESFIGGKDRYPKFQEARDYILENETYFDFLKKMKDTKENANT